MLYKNGAGPAAAETTSKAPDVVGGDERDKYISKPSGECSQAWALYQGRSRTPLLRVVPDSGSPLYRVAWPDIGLSPTANLTRCLNAARDWAEWQFVAEHRNLGAARRLNSLNNFSWSASPMRQNGGGHA
jgi:hypothetical protein